MANKTLNPDTVHPQEADDNTDCLHRQTKSLARIHDAFGPLGDSGDYVADTAPHTGDWRAIMAHEATLIESATSSTIAGALHNVNLVAGQVWFGRFSAIQLAYGSVTAYDRID
jgi:hypothetical protein